MKPHLLLLHGALGNKDQFEHLMDALSDQFMVWSFSFLGHDGTYPIQDFTIQRFSDQVVDFLDSRNIDRVNIFGYSMGGYVALKTALHRPERIDRIVTLGTKFDWNPKSAEQEVKMLNPDIIVNKVPKYAAQLISMYGEDNWKQVLFRTGHMMRGLAGGLCLKNEELKKIDPSIKIMVGSNDRMVSEDESRQMAERLPNAQFELMDDWPHPIDKLNTNELVKVLIRVLNE